MSNAANSASPERHRNAASAIAALDHRGADLRPVAVQLARGGGRKKHAVGMAASLHPEATAKTFQRRRRPIGTGMSAFGRAGVAFDSGIRPQ
jgi:hypothetical protein